MDDPNQLRQAAAYVHRVNGAYLIHLVGEYAGDRTEDENFNAASSLVVAKRLAVEGARGNWFRGPIRWLPSNARAGAPGAYWVLEMTVGYDDEAEVDY